MNILNPHTTYTMTDGHLSDGHLSDEHLSDEHLSDEHRDLAQLKALIDLALEDGKITQRELHDIRTAALADGKLTVEECALFSSLILEKVKTGEIQMEW